jgi:hypothetical protein
MEASGHIQNSNISLSLNSLLPCIGKGTDRFLLYSQGLQLNPNCTWRVQSFKLYLANFDIKFWRKFLCFRFLKKVLIPSETSFESFWTSHMTAKMMFWPPFWRIFIRSPAAATFCRPPRVRLRASQESNQFPVLGHVECGGGRFSVRLAFWLFLISWCRTVLGRFPKP